MEAKFTKGEWAIYNAYPDERPSIKIKNHDLLAVGVPGNKAFTPKTMTPYKAIALCGAKTLPEVQANAKLIAAAPDLLESLIALSDLVEKIHKDAIIGKPIRKRAIKAIKKATE